MPDRVAVILAAGEGKRMHSPLPKVLHRVDGIPLVIHVLRTARDAGLDRLVVVIGHGRDEVRAEIDREWDCEFVLQPVQRGTADAVGRAMEVLDDFRGTVVVLSGDVPLIRVETLEALLDEHERGRRGVTLLSAELENPAGYGRIVRDDAGLLRRIVEEKDASEEEKRIREFNSGIYCFDAEPLRAVLGVIGWRNEQHEFYLTDAVELMKDRRIPVGARRVADADEVLGVNTVDDLDRVRAVYRSRHGKN